MLSLMKNPRLFLSFQEGKKISADSYMGDLVYFAWNNRRKPVVQGRLEITDL